ncbi:hypothetical protein NDN08_007274 [Rhodosorus marinus]|uniref:Biogenesis of lysosome-related organelles complex 1 subunit 7 n=1 Tax=Rhodosorus marinus TaxID=101924 RepID=A0AAV8UG20_9RHOD|nr:hypothetical protein NDN08_007274 [Rhodosorus marinus]
MEEAVAGSISELAKGAGETRNESLVGLEAAQGQLMGRVVELRAVVDRMSETVTSMPELQGAADDLLETKRSLEHTAKKLRKVHARVRALHEDL